MKTLAEIAELLGGILRGDGSLVIERVVHPSMVEGPRDIALVLSPKVFPLVESKGILAVVAPQELAEVKAPNVILVDRPRVALAKLTQLFELPVHVDKGIHATAVIDRSARIGANVSIGPNCWVGPETVLGDNCRIVANVSIGRDVVLGADCVVHAGVRIGDRTRIGNRVILQPNVNIGGDGFAFVTPQKGSVESVRESGSVKSYNNEIIRIHSLGNVVLEDDVEIGAGSCVDRGTLGETRIGRGSKLDNMVQVGHNVTIGQNCLIVAQVGLGGSSRVGDRAVIGGQTGLPDQMSIGEDAVVYAKSGIMSDVPPGTVVAGIPAISARAAKVREIHIRRIPDLATELKELKKRVEELEKLLEDKA
ncbi:MAG: UDP-3-O-(3-hydroxymyristoyl)glucosamine N-acyltransferase [Verrucomicrobia bacterium]|nr:UDP-3-O-(3-hydroxymyristoyl)glucosamine N-acyltransferase [Verrucomicrobiota bacterium]